jgi:hypothetical protein
MIHSLMLLIVLNAVCSAIGYGLGVNHANAWFMVIVCLSIWFTVPIGYFIGVLTNG